MVRATDKQLLLPELGNDVVARHFDEIADRLVQQGANTFRIQAYRNAAATLRDLKRSVRDILDEQGKAGLLRLPGIGQTMAAAIVRFVETGNVPRLEQLRVESQPQRLFATVAEIGPKLAAEIHTELGIETLADLEAAAWDGRLAQVPGMGNKRIQGVREALAGRFRDTRDRPPLPLRSPLIEQPPVADLLDIDHDYRRLAELDRLPRIAPRRLNPQNLAWLPILRTRRGGHDYTAMFSNTARAHELGMTHDWVVIYRDAAEDSGQWTIITSKIGKLKGKRVVRGREQECAAYYAARA